MVDFDIQMAAFDSEMGHFDIKRSNFDKWQIFLLIWQILINSRFSYGRFDTEMADSDTERLILIMKTLKWFQI